MNTGTIRDNDDDVVREVLAQLPDEGHDKNAHLKRKINNLLWEVLPNETTIKMAELIACRIFKMIDEA